MCLGIQGLAEKLHVDLSTGIIPNDLEDREKAFGSNMRPAPKRTPFCTLFWNALQDFMLRILLVCACISIIFDEAFAETESSRSTGKE
jgi:magnesium-transporting ATPase (P-type)